MRTVVLRAHHTSPIKQDFTEFQDIYTGINLFNGLYRIWLYIVKTLLFYVIYGITNVELVQVSTIKYILKII